MMRLLAQTAIFAVLAGGASAATLDFSGVQGANSGTVAVDGAIITHESSGTILVGFGAAGQDDGFCFIGTGCAASGTLDFTSAVTNLTFDIDRAQTGDSVDITAFDGLTALVTQTFTMDGLVDFSNFASVTSLLFEDSSSAAGVGYSTFTFDLVGDGGTDGPSAVPLPAGGLLLLTALGAAAGLRRRKKAA